MSRLVFQNLADYHAQVKNLIAVSQVSNDWTAIKRVQKHRNAGTLFAKPFLRFNDGAIMYSRIPLNLYYLLWSAIRIIAPGGA